MLGGLGFRISAGEIVPIPLHLYANERAVPTGSSCAARAEWKAWLSAALLSCAC